MSIRRLRTILLYLTFIAMAAFAASGYLNLMEHIIWQ